MQIDPSKLITLTRDCIARLVPSAELITLKQGSEVTITQALGGSYTVYYEGNLARIADEDADALGYQPAQLIASWAEEEIVDEEKVWEILSTCYDPEIPVNIVELGLIYRCEMQEAASASFNVIIDMTLTAPGCGMGPVLMDEVKQKLLKLNAIENVEVNLVFDPPWNQALMSEAAKLQLGML